MGDAAGLVAESRLIADRGKVNDRLHARLGKAGDAEFVRAAFGDVLGTRPTEDELAACLGTLTELRAVLKDAKAGERERRARLQLIQALLNHNDFVTVR